MKNQNQNQNQKKNFPSKLVASSWNMCPVRKYPTIGFSGTNDISLLFPISIEQKDLKILQDTNDKNEKIFLNNTDGCTPLPSEHGEEMIKLVNQRINSKESKPSNHMIVDCGALIIDMKNKDFALRWLDTSDKYYHTAVYYDEGHLMTINREGRECPFSLSPFATGYLTRCLIYLDDEHSRGTDLKLPLDAVSCVTLGKGLTKDKMMQACFRLRQFGKGQKIWCVCSREVQSQITHSDTTMEINSQMILEWAQRNSLLEMKKQCPSWIMRGYQFKSIPWDIIASASSKEEVQKSCKRVEQEERNSLAELYDQNFRDIPSIQFLDLLTKSKNVDLLEMKNHLQMNPILAESKVTIGTENSSSADEESQRELENENEVEISRENPPYLKPRKPEHLEYLKQICKSRTFSPHYRIKMFSSLFEKTSIMATQQHKTAKYMTILKNFKDKINKNNTIFVTEEFLMVSDSPTLLDKYFRPFEYFVLFDDGVILWLTSYEANYLVHYFRSGQFQSKLCSYSKRNHSKATLLCTKPQLCLPSSFGLHSLTEENLIEIMLCTGSLYFGSVQIQDMVLEFLSQIKETNPKEPRITYFNSGKVAIETIVLEIFKDLLDLNWFSSPPRLCHIARLFIDYKLPIDQSKEENKQEEKQELKEKKQQ